MASSPTTPGATVRVVRPALEDDVARAVIRARVRRRHRRAQRVITRL